MGRALRGAALIGAFLLAAPGAFTRAQDVPGTADEVSRLSAVLLDRTGTTTRSARFEAARRLAQREADSPEARQALLAALQERSSPATQAAAAAAIAEDAQPNPVYIDALFVLIAPDSTAELARPAAMALSRFRDLPTVLTRLIDRSADRRGEASRRAVIEALGFLAERRSAQTLIDLLNGDDESREVRQSAAAALRDMTGATANGNDVGRWNAWWQQNQGLSEADFRSALVESKAARFDALKPSYERLSAEVLERIGQFYRAAPPERRADLLLDVLSSSEPAFRAAGATIVREDRATAAVVPEAVQEQLRQMVGDSDPSVRLAVANALGALNFGPALEAMLAQLAVETSPDVRAALARAVAPAQDLRAVPVLLDLLRDPDRSVARAAAVALRDLGGRLRAEGPEPLAARTAAELRDALRRPPEPGGEELREALVEATVPLRRNELIPDLQQLLRPRETPRIRRAAVKALAQFGSPMADSIAPQLADPDPSVRLEVVQSLATLGRPEDLPTLQRHLGLPVEPDPSVQQAAWSAMAAILPSTPVEQLRRVAGYFGTETEQDRTRRLAVLRELESRLDADGNVAQRAEVREDIGQTLMAATPPSAADAAPFFRQARDDYKASASPVGVERMTAALMRALLQAGQYADAMAFATSAIGEAPVNAETVGALVKNEAERLVATGDSASAEKLIAESETMTPPLPDRFRRELANIQADIRAQNIDGVRDRATPPRGPRSATIEQPPLPPISVG